MSAPATIGCIDAEVALLGCLLRLPAQDVLAVARRLVGEDLTDPRHRAVLAAVAVVASQGVAPDPVLVLGHLRRLGLERSFSADREAGVYLLDLYGAAGVPGNVEAYLRIVLEHAYRRRLLDLATRVEQHAGTAPLDELGELVDVEVAAVRAAARRCRSAGPAALAAVA